MIYRLLFISVLFSTFSFGQELIYTNYNVSDGLSSNAVYYSFQDSKGYIWFGTDAGATRYDGILWEKYGIDEGISGIDVFQIHEDKFGRIWFLCGDGSLCYYSYQLEKIVSLPDKTALTGSDNAMFYYGVKEYKNKIFLGSNVGGITEILENGAVKTHYSGEELRATGVDLLFEENGELFGIYGDKVVQYNSEKSSFEKVIDLPPQSFPRSEQGEDQLYLGLKNIVLIYDIATWVVVDTIVLPENTSVLSLNYNEANLWIGTDNGVYTTADLEHSLEGCKVTSVTMDHEKGVWISTLGKGVFYSKSEEAVLYKNKNTDLDLSYFEFDSKINHLAIGNYKYINFQEEIDSNLSNIRPKSLHFQDRIERIREGGLQRLDDSPGFGSKVGVHFMARQIQKVGDSIYYCRFSGLYKLPVNWISRGETKLLFEGNVSTFYVDEANKIWIGENDGLWLLENGKKEHVIAGVKVSLIQSIGAYVFVSTRGNGLYIYKDYALIAHFTKEAGLADSFCNYVFQDERGGVWVATQSGITLLEQSGKNLNFKLLAHGNSSLTRTIQEVVVLDEEYVWLDTDDGIIRLNYPIEESNFPLGIELKTLRVNDIEVEKKAILELDYDQNNIHIVLSGLTYKSPPSFIYRLGGEGSSWVKTESPFVELTNLSPNTYHFEAYAISRNGEKSPNMLEFEIIIHPPFWNSWWFRLIIVVFVIAMIYLFFKIRVLTYNRDIVREILLSISKKIKRERFIIVKNVKNGTSVRVNLGTIMRINGAKDYVVIITTKQEIMVKMTMKKTLALINKEEENFYRIHQSHIINIKHVKAVHSNYVLMNQEEIPVGRAFKNEGKRVKERHFN